ncbi:DUF6360 family protein [Haloferax sp. DFSO52]|uniref:DUF6360 family protein n=1 Tax=Haloferax sp. DFSO52 TaxID=3388505 RepID=UPI003A83F431
MSGRVLDVTSHTTLDYVEVSVRGVDWEREGVGILDVYTPKDDPDSVVVEFELDPTTTDRVESHADAVVLTREQSRALRDALDEELDSDGSDRPRRLSG